MRNKRSTSQHPGNGKGPSIAIIWEPSSDARLYQNCITKGARRKVDAQRAKQEWHSFRELCTSFFDQIIVIPPSENAPSVDYQFVMDSFGPTINDGNQALVLSTVPTKKRQWEIVEARKAIHSIYNGEIGFIEMDSSCYAAKMRSVLDATIRRKLNGFPLVGGSTPERKLIGELFECDFSSPDSDLTTLNHMIDRIEQHPDVVNSEGGDFMWGWLPTSDDSPGKRRRTAFVGIPKNLDTARTNLQGCRRFVLAMLVQGERVLPVHFDNGGPMLHLSTAFGILGANRDGRQGLIVNPESIDAQPLRALGYEVLEVNSEDYWSAGGFAGLSGTGGLAVLPQQFPRTISMVEKAGFSVLPVTTEQTSQIDGSLNCWIRVIHVYPTVH